MKLALWQTVGNLRDVRANLRALETVARSAAEEGATLLLCPECWLCGYNIGSGTAALAESHDGPSAQRIASIARRNKIAIAYGYAERDPASGRIYNSVQVIGPAASLLCRYRKTHLFGPRERAAYQPGERFEPPFELGGLCFGLLICYDVEFPECVRSLALMGADVILVPTALSVEYTVVPDIIVPARSLENQVFIAYCNHAGAEDDLLYLGGSCLTGTDGKALARAGAREALIFAEVSKAARAATAETFPYRADRRPGLYGELTSDSGRC
jgi:predicted amidohydrolase